MRGYSFRRVAQYARYHYMSQTKNYLSLFLVCIAFPALFGILSRDVLVAEGISTAIYTLGGLAFALRTTYAMRHRGTKIMECSLPLSNEERMTFMLLNLLVVFPLFVLLTSIISMAIVYPFNYYSVNVSDMMSILSGTFLNWSLYVFVQLVMSVSLLLNIIARSNLFVVYLGVFVGIVIFMIVAAHVGIHLLMNLEPGYYAETIEINDTAACVVYILLPVVFYALGYWALCRRQIKW
ncbi:MAG: hypothetical protein IJX40_03730 [Alistipes sp.]|nr:hypothetical protein [Alistipes sp.]